MAQQDANGFEADGWQAMETDGFIGLVGPIYWKRDEHGVRSRFPTGTKHRNRRGVVQGGALMTFADRSMGAAVRDGRADVSTATVQLDVHFIAPVQLGDTVESHPQVMRTQGRTVFVRSELTVAGRVVALASGVWTVSPTPPASR